MRNPGINGEGELRGQPANPGSPGKMAIKTECVCVTMEVVVTTGAKRCAKLQSNHYRQQQTNTQFLQDGCPSCRPTNRVKALKEN